MQHSSTKNHWNEAKRDWLRIQPTSSVFLFLFFFDNLLVKQLQQK